MTTPWTLTAATSPAISASSSEMAVSVKVLAVTVGDNSSPDMFRARLFEVDRGRYVTGDGKGKGRHIPARGLVGDMTLWFEMPSDALWSGEARLFVSWLRFLYSS